MIHPWRVNRLINDPELRIFLQPVLCFPAFVDNVVVHDQRDGFRPTVCRFKPLQQADKQRRTFAVAAHIADFTRSAVQRSGQIIIFHSAPASLRVFVVRAAASPHRFWD